MDLAKIKNELEEERRRLMTQVHRIEGALSALTNVRNATVFAGKQRKRRGVSNAGRARMAAAQRARWAKIKKA